MRQWHGLGLMALGLFGLIAAASAQEVDTGVVSPYFDCPYVNYFDTDCPQLRERETRAPVAGTRSPVEERPRAAPSDEASEPEAEPGDGQGLTPEELILFPRESLAPDAPPVVPHPAGRSDPGKRAALRALACAAHGAASGGASTHPAGGEGVGIASRSGGAARGVGVMFGRGRKGSSAAVSAVGPDFDALLAVLPAREDWERFVNRVVLCCGELPAPEGSTTLAAHCVAAGCAAASAVDKTRLWERLAPAERREREGFEARVRLGLFFAGCLKYLLPRLCTVRVRVGKAEWEPFLQVVA